MLKERRKHKRYDINLEVKGSSGEVLFIIKNISKNGMYAESSKEYELFSVLTFCINLSDSIYELKGIIVRQDVIKNSRYPYRIALYFLDADKDFQNAVEAMLQERAALEG